MVMSKRKDLSFKLKTVKLVEEVKTKEASACDFHKVFTAHWL